MADDPLPLERLRGAPAGRTTTCSHLWVGGGADVAFDAENTEFGQEEAEEVPAWRTACRRRQRTPASAVSRARGAPGRPQRAG
jgi:hypothetical protein